MSFFDKAKEIANKAKNKIETVANDTITDAKKLIKTELIDYITKLKLLNEADIQLINNKIDTCEISVNNINDVISQIKSMNKENITKDNIMKLLNNLCKQSGGYYYKKYLKYKHKYMNLKAQLNL